MGKGQNEGKHSLVVRDLGCEEFTSRSGKSFDASIITAYFPSEASNKEAMLLVIIEPQKVQQAQESPGTSSGVCAPGNHNTGGGTSRTDRRGGHSSGNSEVSTIHPDDSASNIQYMGRR